MKLRGGPKVLLALLVAVILASACGARVTDEQRAAATGSVGVAAGQRDSSGQLTTNEGPGSDANAPTGNGSQSSSGGVGPSDGTATTLPAGGNGGATDVGVTADTITLGLVTTLSGPIPGLFQGASVGAQAFAAFVNSQGGVFGRKLKIIVRDDQFDAGQNRAQTRELMNQVLGFVGSFSTFDDPAQPDLEKAGIPDVGYGLTDGRRNSPVNFSPQPAKSGTFRTGPFLYYAKHFPDAVKAMGTLWGDVPASKGGAVDSMAAAESVGWKWAYSRGYQPTESDFTADVVRMRQAGVKGFYTVAADSKTMARILKAFAQQSFKPEFIAFGASGYDILLPALAGSAAEGVYVDQQLALYQGTDAAAVPEVGLLDQWAQKVKPGYTPDLFAAYAWASGRLLLQALQASGPQLTRKALLAQLQKIDNFDANGLMAPAGPASKRQPACDMFMRVQGGKFVRVDPPGKGFLCEGSIFTKR
jgi:ABC-type branched-subunit amino acid transport system substrate-binding protein